MLLTLLVIVCVLGVLLVAAMVAVSDRDLLVEVAPDGPGTTLPAGRVGAEDVDALRFGLAFRGYRMDEVDRSLARLAQELAERDARIAQLEGAIADAVGTAVDQAEARLAVDHAQQAEEAQRAEAAAELAAAREEVGAPGQGELGDVDGAAEQGPDRPQQAASGLAAVAAWGPITTTSVSAPWVQPATEAPAAEAPEPEPEPEPEAEAEPEAEQEPGARASAPLVAPAPQAPPWPAAEPTHPEPLVPDAARQPDGEPAAPDAASAVPAAPDEAAGQFDFPEVVPPAQAAPELPEATDADADAAGRAAPSAYRSEPDEDRGIT